MKENKYRGIRCDNGKYVYGSYVESKISWHGHKPHKSWIIASMYSNGGWVCMGGRYAVSDESVAQYINVKDCHNNEIYEQDLVMIFVFDETIDRYTYFDCGEVRYSNGTFYIGVTPLCTLLGPNSRYKLEIVKKDENRNLP